MGAVIFGMLALYLIISIIVVIVTVRGAKKRGKSLWLWGLGAALVMYLIPFWDWVPTVVAHKYYCSTEAGFWVYKTPEQWKAENPGEFENLTSFVTKNSAPSERDGDMENYTDTYFLNERFNWIIKHNGKLFPNRWRHEQKIIDTKTNEVLARYIDFSTSQERRQAGLSGWKFWLYNEHCSGGELDQSKLRQFRNNFMGRGK